MKNILFYSPDFNMCISLLIYLEYGYKVTTTTDLQVLDSLTSNSSFDLVILDVEPLPEVEEIVLNIKNRLHKSSTRDFIFYKLLLTRSQFLINY